MQQEQASLESDRYNLSKVRIESPIDGIVTRRNIEEGETVVVGTMNNAGTVLLTIADMSVIEAEVEVDETDIPTLTARPDGEGHDRRDSRQDLHRQGHRDRQQPDPGRRAGAAAAGTQATNFKVVVTLDGRDPGGPPGLHVHGRDHDRHARQDVVGVPIQATTVREVVVDDKGEIVREPQTEGTRRPRPGGGPGLRAEARAVAQGARGRLRRA